MVTLMSPRARTEDVSPRLRSASAVRSHLTSGSRASGSRRVSIDSDAAVGEACTQGRRLAGTLGFSAYDQVVMATMISELARNIMHHAYHGQITMRAGHSGNKPAIVVVAKDDGPGIRDVDGALDGSTSFRGSGKGLPAVRRSADRFRIITEEGRGTVVSFAKLTA